MNALPSSPLSPPQTNTHSVQRARGQLAGGLAKKNIPSVLGTLTHLCLWVFYSVLTPGPLSEELPSIFLSFACSLVVFDMFFTLIQTRRLQHMFGLTYLCSETHTQGFWPSWSGWETVSLGKGPYCKHILNRHSATICPPRKTLAAHFKTTLLNEVPSDNYVSCLLLNVWTFTHRV